MKAVPFIVPDSHRANGIDLSRFFGFAPPLLILAPTRSLMQAKVASDVQGRIFVALNQLVIGASSLDGLGRS